MTNNLRQLSDQGVSIWLDDLSRQRITSGNLTDLIQDWSVVGITSNPTIFQTAITKSSEYDDQIRRLAAKDATAEQVVHELTTEDVRDACDVMAPVFERTGGQDGRVSIEVDPRLAHDTEATVRQAHELWDEVGRPNLFVKIPATRAGLPAIRRCLADGLSINVTLIFALERYGEVMEAFLAGLEDRIAAGQPVDNIRSVASFFVSRVDSEVDKRLEKIGTPGAMALRGKAAVANARLAYQAYEEVFGSERWQALAAHGAHPQRPLWASTSTKNPDYPDTLYVTELVVPGVVNTMPQQTLEAVADHGEIRGDTIKPFYDDARQVMADLKMAGVDMADVTRVLEDEGVEKFSASWHDLYSSMSAKLEALR